MSGKTDIPVEFGKFGRAQGLRGEVRFWAHNPRSPLLAKGQKALVGRSPHATDAMVINRVRRDAKGILLGFVGCDDRNSAEALTGQHWYCSRTEFTPLSDDEIYIADLIGMTALGGDKDTLGTVKDVVEVGPNLILVIKVGHREVMVPYVDEFVSDVNLENKQLTIRVIEGLLETGRA